MKKEFLIVILVGIFVVLGCKKPEDSCDEEKLAASFVLDYPDTVLVGSPFNLNVGYVVENSCGDFGRFDGEIVGSTIDARLITYYTGCNCVNEFEEKTASYPIIFEEPDTYELRFWISENEYESYLIVAVE